MGDPVTPAELDSALNWAKRYVEQTEDISLGDMRNARVILYLAQKLRRHEGRTPTEE